MSLLPQHKKSAEELAKLRESFGTPGPTTIEEISAPEAALPIEEAAASEAQQPEATAQMLESLLAAQPVGLAPPPKIVRSLKRSERLPSPPRVSSPRIVKPVLDAALPICRHSDLQILEIRRLQQLAIQNSGAAPRVLRAHPVIVALGYLAVVAGAVGYYFYDLEIKVAMGGIAGGLLIAVFIFLRKPLSLHHAAFIAMAALLVIVFGSLHYFPNLQHGT